MKKLIFTLALLIQTVFVFADAPALEVARVATDEVKMYRQAGTSSEVVQSLKSTDQVALVRKHNANWSIVTVNGEVGYVLTSELTLTKQDKKGAGKSSRNRF